jgi:hypothetical protein
VVLNHDSLKLVESPVMHLNGEGGKYLLGLLSTEPFKIGMTVTDVKIDDSTSVIVNEVLGSGGSSIVFKGTISEVNFYSRF